MITRHPCPSPPPRPSTQRAELPASRRGSHAGRGPALLLRARAWSPRASRRHCLGQWAACHVLCKITGNISWTRHAGRLAYSLRATSRHFFPVGGSLYRQQLSCKSYRLNSELAVLWECGLSLKSRDHSACWFLGPFRGRIELFRPDPETTSHFPKFKVAEMQ